MLDAEVLSVVVASDDFNCFLDAKKHEKCFLFVCLFYFRLFVCLFNFWLFWFCFVFVFVFVFVCFLLFCFFCSIRLSKVVIRLRFESLKLIGSAMFGAALNLHGYTCQTTLIFGKLKDGS